jgi:enamine deaminase RidA (YjgF/YER057c/UK114 family)
MSQRDDKLASLGFPLDRFPKPGAIYRPVVIDGATIYVSGCVPFDGDKLMYKGKAPSQVSLEDAKQAAALCVANSLRLVRNELGTLDKVERVIRLTGYVNSDLDFTDHHLVINGASQLLLDVFGNDAGLGARSAVGMANLPLGSTVEVDLILKMKPV